MINPWFKFYGSEYLADPKIGSLSAQERSCWITLLCLASASTTGGTIEYLTVEVLLEKSGIHFDPYHPEEWNACISILSQFERMKMIEKNDNGNIVIKNWEKRQEHNLTVAERVAKHRENKKCNENVTIDVTNVTTEKNRIEKNRKEKNRINKDNTSAKDKPLRLDSDLYSFKEFYEDMKKSPQRHINLIGEYADEINANFTTRGQWKSFVTRNLRAAKLLTPFTDEQMSIALGKIKGEKFLTSWTLETLLKYITK